MVCDVGGGRYGDDVAATYSVDEQHHAERHPLSKGASPEAIAAALLPEDRTEFLAELDEVLATVRGSLDLTELFTMLEHWRRVAALQADPKVFARVARRAAELRSSPANTRTWKRAPRARIPVGLSPVVPRERAKHSGGTAEWTARWTEGVRPEERLVPPD